MKQARGGAPGGGARAAAPLALAVLVALAAPARAQEPDTPPDSTAAGQGAARPPATGGPVSVDSADAIRRSLTRPPARPRFDGVDAVALPFRVAFFPLQLVGSGLAELIGIASEIEPPGGLAALFRPMAEWGLVPGIGPIGPRSGVGLQLRLVRFDPFFLETGVSVRGSQRHRAGLLFGARDPVPPPGSEEIGLMPLAGEGPPGGIPGAVAPPAPGPTGERLPSSHLEAAYGFERHGHVLFWGAGPESLEGDRSDFQWDRQAAEVSGGARLGSAWVGGGAAFEDNRVDRGFDDGLPDVQDRFGAALPFGVAERTEYARFDGRGALDLTHTRGFQRRGVFLAAGASLYRGVDGTESDFHRLDGRAHGYLPLNLRQQLAVQGIVKVTRSDGGAGVPFTHLAGLGDREGGRAYDDGRFRDLDMAAVMAEFRWEVWRELHHLSRVESFLFLDLGGVAPRLGELDGEDLRESYGFGFRYVAGHRLGVLGYLAFGDEGTRVQATFDWAY